MFDAVVEIVNRVDAEQDFVDYVIDAEEFDMLADYSASYHAFPEARSLSNTIAF